MKSLLAAALVIVSLAGSALAIDEAHKAKGEKLIVKAVDYLRSKQDAKSGGWGVPSSSTPGAAQAQPVFPAFTGLVLNGLLMQPGVTTADPAVDKGVKFILSYAKPDGGIYDTLLPSYNTAICLSALARVDTPDAKKVIKAGQEFLRNTQWGSPTPMGVGGLGGKDGPTSVVGPEHPFYGGVGYGGGGRPDISNLQFMLQAFQETGVPADDLGVKRALVFLQRCQMLDKGPDGKIINDQPYARGTLQGGFIYSVAETGETIGQGESKAGMIEETLDDGSKVSRLRAYGSVTYSGFKSYVYAGLAKDDPRVTAAWSWITANYTLAENPGIGQEGYYYYLLAFSRCLDATGKATIETTGPAGAKVARDWRNDLIDRLAELQNDDGSFKSVNKRWMEDNPVMITAFGLIALQHAVRD